MNVDDLKNKWFELGNLFFKDKNLITFYWQHLLKNYSGKKRYYHNLNHIYSMLLQAEENKSKIINYSEVLFAIWFHDIIYKASSKLNEEKSADFAKSALANISSKELKIDVIYNLIISTKKHQILLPENSDNAFLLDFDLSILGKDWNDYLDYIQNIRKEYKIYPDFLYNPGRKKVLQNFLKRETLFFTEKYQQVFEAKARENLKKEIQVLS